MCCYRDVRNFEKFNNIVQVILNKAISFIQTLPKDCQDEQEEQQRKSSSKGDTSSPPEKSGKTDESGSDGESSKAEKILEAWTLDEKDKLLNFVSKVFLMNFPVYVAYKHTVHTTLEELSTQEAAALNNYCELNVSPFFRPMLQVLGI